MKILTLVLAASTLVTMPSLAHGQSNYFQFGNLNNAPVNVTTSWTKLNTTSGSHSFTKTDSLSVLEVHVNSRFGVGTLTGSNGIRFRVRVDNMTPSIDNMGSLLTGNSSAFLSMFAVFRNVSAGNHTVSIWAATAAGSASGVVVDPGGWGGKIIVKESR
jgi:hypothetical protein